jgi:2-keto-4-pentenoate hydratase
VTTASTAQELALARREARRLTSDASPVVADVAEAYQIQSALAALTQNDVRGWKVTALTLPDQQKFLSSRPVAGIMLGGHVHPAPATLALSDFIAPLLECEIAFVLGRDLPERTVPYQRSDIVAAIAHVLPVFEISDSRVSPDAANLLKLADCMAHGALIAGSEAMPLDVTNVDIVLRHGDEILQHGSSARILGDPVLAVQALANAQPLPAPLKKGQIVTTGTCTDPVELRRGEYAADFGPLGVLRMTVV